MEKAMRFIVHGLQPLTGRGRRSESNPGNPVFLRLTDENKCAAAYDNFCSAGWCGLASDIESLDPDDFRTVFCIGIEVEGLTVDLDEPDTPADLRQE